MVPNQLEEIKNAVMSGDKNRTLELVERAVKEVSAPDIIEKALNPAMTEVGAKMNSGEVFVPEVLLAARAMKESIKALKPYLMQDSQERSKGTVVIGTVEGDLHDIGKNIVGVMMEGVGFKVVDLGIDVPCEKFIEAVKEHSPVILGMSAILSSTLKEMKTVIADLNEQGLRKRVKVLVGGAAVSYSFAEQIGADGYGPNAGKAVELALDIAR